MDNRAALNPKHSVIVEACAGSGKTWLLVSRVLRLLLAGVKPGEILAITFTRKAAQEMQARLNEWLHFLATHSDDEVHTFLQAREMYEVDAGIMARARNLYRESLLMQPGITINTFHGWFMQIAQGAPLNSNMPLGMNLLEHTSTLQDEAWQEFTDNLQAAPESETSLALQWLFAEYGLHNTQILLNNFLHKRAEWWAYVGERNDGQGDAVAFALQQLRDEFGVEASVDPIAELFADDTLQHAINNFSAVLATDGTDKQRRAADSLQAFSALADIQQRYTQITQCLYTRADEPRIFTPTKKQNAESFISAHEVLLNTMQVARDAIMARALLRLNAAALRCGATLLQHYQDIKSRQQQIDFVDVEWQVCHLLRQSDYAEYMQYKLDSRYSHVLLDEFQDTNPVQWQVLQAWFAAAEAVQSRPTVFVVGDPKQSIYRFRRADARLFGEVSGWLQNNFDARYLSQNITRRNAPAILKVVNKIFGQHPNGFTDFETHIAHQTTLPGKVAVLPLLEFAAEPDVPALKVSQLRHPLFTARAEKQSDNRELEASQFAEKIINIVTHWQVSDGSGVPRPAEFSDIMVLVRKRLHLQIYEHALRQRHIPFLTSRRGGLLNTLETEDMQALLTFLITPFADLELAQTLRSPLFACTDADLMQLAASSISTGGSQPKHGSWWQRLQQLAAHKQVSPELLRAHQFLSGWIKLADKLPVHDLLDHIYFEADVVHRYVAALPVELHELVRANLQAFMGIALNVDAGRY
ncbi:MAG: UvrD-helicase domain-containing protein, partial [Candidatus Nitrotoga sp.]